MSSQWEEMEMFESDSDPLAVSTACWLGQYTFGIIASVIFGGISKIFFSSTSLAATIGSTLGVFAGSSGGQNPCETSSGGGLYALALIFTNTAISVHVVNLWFIYNDSLLAKAFTASSVSVISGGLASSYYRNHSTLVREGGLALEIEHKFFRGGRKRTVYIEALVVTFKDELANPEAVSRSLGVIVLSSFATIYFGGMFDVLSG